MRPSEVPEFVRGLYPRAGKAETIGRPVGYSEEEIGSLPALRDHSDPRFPAIRSYWRPDAVELGALNDGGYIELEVIGHYMVPVALNVVVPGPDDDASVGQVH